MEIIHFAACTAGIHAEAGGVTFGDHENLVRIVPDIILRKDNLGGGDGGGAVVNADIVEAKGGTLDGRLDAVVSRA